MTDSFPKEKLRAIISRCCALCQNPKATVLELTHLIGTLSSIAQAVLPARLQFRYPQRQQILALQANQTYQTAIYLNSKSIQNIDMVESKSGACQWGVSYNVTTRNVHSDRCVEKTMRGPLPRHIHRGYMVFPGTNTTNQCAGTNGSKVGHSDFHEKETRKFNLPTSRQYDSPVISIKNGSTWNETLVIISNEIWDYISSHKITINAKYLPSSLNTQADDAS